MLADLSPFDVSEDLRTNPFQKRRNDENQFVKSSQEPLSIHGGLITKVRTKKMKEVLNRLIEHISYSCLV